MRTLKDIEVAKMIDQDTFEPITQVSIKSHGSTPATAVIVLYPEDIQDARAMFGKKVTISLIAQDIRAQAPWVRLKQVLQILNHLDLDKE